jgi:hypothetical protein
MSQTSRYTTNLGKTPQNMGETLVLPARQQINTDDDDG